MNEGGSLSGQVNTLLDELRASLAFLTRLPASVTGYDPVLRPDFTTAARMFPLAGAIIGAVGGVAIIVGWLLGLFPFVTAILAAATTIIVTGALHEDGLADSADSLGGTTRERKFEIMDDSRVGTFGTIAVTLSILLRALALTAILAKAGPLSAALALVAAEAVSRAALVRMWHDLPAARASGLAADTGAPHYNAMLVALVVTVVIVVLLALPALGWRATALASVLAVVAAYAVIRVAADTLGGRTGDTLGACQQVALAAFLVGASAV